MLKKVVAKKNGCHGRCLQWKVVAKDNDCYRKWLLSKAIAIIMVAIKNWLLGSMAAIENGSRGRQLLKILVTKDGCYGKLVDAKVLWKATAKKNSCKTGSY